MFNDLTVPWCKLCRRKVFLGVKYAMKKKNVDTWTTWKLYENANSVSFVDLTLYYWKNNKDSLTNESFSIESFNAIEAYIYQMNYYLTHDKKRLFEIVFEESVDEFFWCYNRGKNTYSNQLEQYFLELKSNFKNVKITKGIGVKKYVRFFYLMYYKIPRLLK